MFGQRPQKIRGKVDIRIASSLPPLGKRVIEMLALCSPPWRQKVIGMLGLCKPPPIHSHYLLCFPWWNSPQKNIDRSDMLNPFQSKNARTRNIKISGEVVHNTPPSPSHNPRGVVGRGISVFGLFSEKLPHYCLITSFCSGLRKLGKNSLQELMSEQSAFYDLWLL